MNLLIIANFLHCCAACDALHCWSQSLDQKGVGQLIEMATTKGRSARPDLKVGICGEQGGDPASVEFVHRVGLDYVSCSPFRVPIARLAAAQAAIKYGRPEKQ
jgi:pyruvate,orthophosphate dikinase